MFPHYYTLHLQMEEFFSVVRSGVLRLEYYLLSVEEVVRKGKFCSRSLVETFLELGFRRNEVTFFI